MIAFFFFFFFYSIFSERLKHAMKKQNITPAALAAKSDVFLVTVKRWLNGSYEPRHINLCKIACELNISADYLCGLES